MSILEENKYLCPKYYFLLHISYKVKDHIDKGQNFMFLRIKNCIDIIFLDMGLVSHYSKLNKEGLCILIPQIHSFKSQLCF